MAKIVLFNAGCLVFVAVGIWLTFALRNDAQLWAVGPWLLGSAVVAFAFGWIAIGLASEI